MGTKKAVEIIKMYQEIFGSNNFFLEVQDHPQISDQILVNQYIFRISKLHGIPVVATNDNHYCRKSDHDVHDILLCIQTGKNLQDTNRMHYTGDFSIRHPDEMKNAFSDNLDAIKNTLEIAARQC